MIIFLAGFKCEEVQDQMRYKKGNLYTPAIDYLKNYDIYPEFASVTKLPKYFSWLHKAIIPLFKKGIIPEPTVSAVGSWYFTKFYKAATIYLMRFLPYKLEDNTTYIITNRKFIQPFTELMFVMPRFYTKFTPEQRYLYNKAKEKVYPAVNGGYYYV